MTATQWFPKLNKQQCNECGDCVTSCPTGALQWREGKVTLVDPDACAYCATCETVCSLNAIELPYLVINLSNEGEIS